MAFRKAASWVVGRRGYRLVRADKTDRRSPHPCAAPSRAPENANLHADFTGEELATIQAVAPFTMTSPERVVGLIRAVEYLASNAIDGDVVECGIWRGGSMMAIARTLLRLADTTRTLHLFDTFEGMTPPTEFDRDPAAGKSAAEILSDADRDASNAWAVASLPEVRANLDSTGYPQDRLRYVRGPVERTLATAAPERIALLRLDTDWYESTLHELETLFPRLVSGGVLIVDDYGHWEGARKAVDEYIAAHHLRLLLCRLDYTGRIAVKT